MRKATAILLAMASPALASVGVMIQSGIFPENKMEPAGVGEVNVKRAYKQKARSSKGGSSKGGSGSNKCPAASGKGNCGGVCLGDSCCEVWPVFFNLDELESKFVETAVGFGFDNVPFYSYENGGKLGVYSEETTVLMPQGTSVFGCLGSGAYTFLPASGEASQISLQFTCDATNMGEDSITGGNGAFGCASGVEDFLFSSEGGILVQALLVCGQLCPLQLG